MANVPFFIAFVFVGVALKNIYCFFLVGFQNAS